MDPIPVVCPVFPKRNPGKFTVRKTKNWILSVEKMKVAESEQFHCSSRGG